MTDEELEEQIQDFIQQRAEKKSPLTEIGIKRLRARAIRFRAKGYDMVEVFDKAVFSGWQTIWPPKPEDKAARPSSFKEYEGPDYGERTEPEKARANVAQLRSMVRR